MTCHIMTTTLSTRKGTIVVDQPTTRADQFAVCLHAGVHAEHAGEWMLTADTAVSAISLADWFGGEQLQILARGRHAARRAKSDAVMELLADSPKGITTRDVHRARVVNTASEARALLAQMGIDGELTHKESMPEGGGHITLIYSKARK